MLAYSGGGSGLHRCASWTLAYQPVMPGPLEAKTTFPGDLA